MGGGAVFGADGPKKPKWFGTIVNGKAEPTWAPPARFASCSEVQNRELQVVANVITKVIGRGHGRELSFRCNKLVVAKAWQQRPSCAAAASREGPVVSARRTDVRRSVRTVCILSSKYISTRSRGLHLLIRGSEWRRSQHAFPSVAQWCSATASRAPKPSHPQTSKCTDHDHCGRPRTDTCRQYRLLPNLPPTRHITRWSYFGSQRTLPPPSTMVVPLSQLGRLGLGGRHESGCLLSSRR